MPPDPNILLILFMTISGNLIMLTYMVWDKLRTQQIQEKASRQPKDPKMVQIEKEFEIITELDFKTTTGGKTYGELISISRKTCFSIHALIVIDCLITWQSILNS